jgi:dienelactone hydrolase
MHAKRTTRRSFLKAAGLASFGGAIAPDTHPADVADPHGSAPPADPTRELKPSGADLGSLYGEVEKLASANRYSLSFRSGRFRTHEEFRVAAKEKILELLQCRPENVKPRAEVVDRVERDDHIRERVLFSTSPHFRVPAYVLIPKKLKETAPAIIDLHSHGGMYLFGKEKVVDLGNNHPAMTAYHRRNYDGRPTATELVCRGYVVITIDALMFGERRLMLDADLKSGWDRSQYSVDDVTRLNQQCRAKESTLVKSLVLAGATWPGIVFWDDIRTVDYLITRPEVNAQRIGCLGISMGGYRSMYLAALDERIKAACIVGFMSSVKPMVKAHVDTHSWVHFLPALHRYLDLPDVASLTAPRALMVQQCAKDHLFPAIGMKESIEQISAIYEKAGLKEMFVGRIYDEPHQFTRAMQDDAFAWLDRQLDHKSGNSKG